MELQADDVKVESGGRAATITKKMSIKEEDMHVIIKFLTQTAYSNPLRTAIQEYMSNARDAQRELGNGDVPIDVKLPTSLDNTFYVRDYGIGITPDRMNDVFVYIGASTKRNDNNQTGGFGLGAKSVFGYIDSFNVTTWVPDEDGILMKYQYIIMKKGKDIVCEQIGKQMRAKEDEKRGTMIQFPISPKDYSESIFNVKRVAYYWKVKPNVIGPKIVFNDVKKDKTGTNWFIETDSQNDHYPIAIVDGIQYPLDKITLKGTSNSKYSKVIDNLWNHSVRLEFETGDVSVTIDREKLDYSNSKMIDLIRSRFVEIYDSLTEEIKKTVEGAEDLFSANCKYHSECRKYGDILGYRPKWNGIDITENQYWHVSALKKGSYGLFCYNTSNGKCSSMMDMIRFSEDSILVVDKEYSKVPSKLKLNTLIKNNPNKVIYILKVSSVTVDFAHAAARSAAEFAKKEYEPDYSKDKGIFDDTVKTAISYWNKSFNLDKCKVIDMATVEKTQAVRPVSTTPVIRRKGLIYGRQLKSGYFDDDCGTYSPKNVLGKREAIDPNEDEMICYLLQDQSGKVYTLDESGKRIDILDWRIADSINRSVPGTVYAIDDKFAAIAAEKFDSFYVVAKKFTMEKIKGNNKNIEQVQCRSSLMCNVSETIINSIAKNDNLCTEFKTLVKDWNATVKEYHSKLKGQTNNHGIIGKASLKSLAIFFGLSFEHCVDSTYVTSLAGYHKKFKEAFQFMEYDFYRYHYSSYTFSEHQIKYINFMAKEYGI